jgi:hypothetical protein
MRKPRRANLHFRHFALVLLGNAGKWVPSALTRH